MNNIYISLIVAISLLSFQCGNDNNDIDCRNISNYCTVKTFDSPAKYKTLNLFMISHQTGFAVGTSGQIMYSNNFGEEWVIENDYNSSNFITRQDLPSIFFLNNLFGIIGGVENEEASGAILLKTENGGETWTKKYFESVYIFSDIILFNELFGIAILGRKIDSINFKYVLSKTNDGGDSWNDYNVGIKEMASTNLIFKDDIIFGTAIDFANLPILLRSNNHGENWEIFPLPTSECNDIYFINRDIGFIICGVFEGSQTVFKTVDSGKTWSLLNNPVFTSNSIIHFKNELEGISINTIYRTEFSGGEWHFYENGYEIYNTNDGGANWSKQALDISCNISGVYFSNSDYNFYTLDENFNTFSIQ